MVPESGGEAASSDRHDDAAFTHLPLRAFSVPGFSDRRLRCVAELPPSDADLLWEGIDTTGRKVWLGSEQLLHWLSWASDEERRAWRGKRVIELGCGAGLVGLFVSQLGPWSYTYTDGSAETVALARANVLANDHASTGTSQGCASRFVQLPWGDADAAQGVVEEAGGRFDRVLACDVIYDRDVVPLLMTTAAALLAEGPSSASFVLSYVSRCVMPEADMISLIYHHAASHGLCGRHVAPAEDPRMADGRLREQLADGDGKVFIFTRSTEGGPAEGGRAEEERGSDTQG